MSRDILAVDVGTTALKLGIFSAGLELRWETSRRYDVHVYGGGKADIHPDEWWRAFADACREAGERLGQVGVVAFSVTTPGLTPMAADGAPLGPGILFFDGRSTAQARWIRERVGEEKFLRETCNLPVTGGSSLASILWIREHQPEVWNAAAKFGHTNTYMVKRLTGEWVIDPSTVSITGLYNTTWDDLTWNDDVLRAAEIPAAKLPPLARSHECAGAILAAVADELGLPRDCAVLTGGNDAVLAAFSGGMTEPGQITNICGTCEITYVCVDQPIWSPNFNVRCHVAPARWVTFFVLNTGGKALEWFRSVFCGEMGENEFYLGYLPAVLESFFADADRREAALPGYSPFLAGSRYSLDPLKAAFTGVTLETTRDDMLMALIRGNALYHGEHLKEVAVRVPLARKVHTTGGGAKIEGVMEAKRRWTGDFDYQYQDQSSLVGAAMLGQIHLRSG
jgi:sugar (pentulose or hexulose) kinase